MRHRHRAVPRYRAAQLRIETDTLGLWGGATLVRLLPLPRDLQESILDRFVRDYSEKMVQFGAETFAYMSSQKR
jgi:hypothetical protein